MKKPENIYVIQKLSMHNDISIKLWYIEYDIEMLREFIIREDIALLYFILMGLYPLYFVNINREYVHYDDQSYSL